MLHGVEGASSSVLYKTQSRSYVMSVSFNSEGTRVVAGDHSGSISVIDVTSLRVLSTTETRNCVLQVAFLDSDILYASMGGIVTSLRASTPSIPFKVAGPCCFSLPKTQSHTMDIDDPSILSEEPSVEADRAVSPAKELTSVSSGPELASPHAAKAHRFSSSPPFELDSTLTDEPPLDGESAADPSDA